MAMADSNRIVFPDVATEIKAAAAAAASTNAESQEKTEPGDTNTVEEAPPTITMRNVVQVPSNCPAGFQMGADGVCREVF